MPSETQQRQQRQNADAARELDAKGWPHAPCITCGCPVVRGAAGRTRCPGCFEVEARLVAYLQAGGDKAIAKIADAFCVLFVGEGDNPSPAETTLELHAAGFALGARHICKKEGL